MRCSIEIIPHLLHFKQPAGTSRGVYTTRRVWYLRLTSVDEPGRVGIGECAPLPILSCDDSPEYEEHLKRICRLVEKQGGVLEDDVVRSFPSIRFGVETALRHFYAGSWQLWDTPFSRGEAGISINGLIWMGGYEEMYRRIKEKVEAGFRCLKLKIGAIEFEQELELLRLIRCSFPAEQMELRVDANGAFSPADALEKLEQLAVFDLHSIEQPIAAGQWEEMARLVANTPLPIALDEELIGLHTVEQKREMLEHIRPHYIVLKPSLHGGFAGCEEWMAEARRQKTGWWITSALESNVGLNAIAQWCATFHHSLPQGLGTGQLFIDNVELPLEIRQDSLWFGKSTSTYTP